ncbi:hypothetical protein AJ80_00104 [Polytolypa hystricis UAMH7299]|uniref:Neutral protease 2 n=1 Tax=Polytolypa hystricis (strain UAMH7299) TaxID=1447883 RepID=A0A2B7YVV1_POLH7|nr:hypothetical protein AJ80_00104 [Polytolypa hystricis UAMH7299]
MMLPVATAVALAALASSAVGAVLPPSQRRADEPSKLSITLTQLSGTQIKAVVKNTGNEDLSLLHLNFFNDKAPIKKASVFGDDGFEVPFSGVRYRTQTDNLSPDVFTHLAPSESFEDTFDIASTVDLSKGGHIKLLSKGLVSYAIGNETKLSGVLRYKSNELDLDIDGPAAAKSFAAMKHIFKRARLTGCSGSQGTETRTALSNSANLSAKAAEAAANGPAAKVQEYFKSTSASVREQVAARFRAVAAESQSETSGATTYYCSDPYGICTSNVLAYTLINEDIIVNCPIYYTVIPGLSTQCHAQDRATTTLHEFTHAKGVYSPGTDDHAYGYQASMALTSAEALDNADSYALFANGRFPASLILEIL